MQMLLKYGASPFRDKIKDYREYKPNRLILMELKRFRVVGNKLIQIRSFMVFFPHRVRASFLKRRASQLPDYLLESTETLVPSLTHLFAGYL